MRGARGVHHRLSRAPADRRASGARVPDREALSRRDGARGGESGTVLQPRGARARKDGVGALAEEPAAEMSSHTGDPAGADAAPGNDAASGGEVSFERDAFSHARQGRRAVGTIVWGFALLILIGVLGG